MAVEKFPTNDEYDAWIGNNMNIYLVGDHGVGKTEMALAACMRLKLKFKYFSVPTLDPWVNFVGIPKEGKNKKGQAVIDFLLPQEMDDDLEVIILDEYPRAKAAIRNAVMELIQFGSINGRKFPKLKCVIACANPHDDDGTYDGERIDPAQLDRFHVHVKVPYSMNPEWCAKKYGAAAASIIAWWDALAPAVRRAVSPRRVAQAYDACRKGIDPECMLPYSAELASFEQICLEGTNNSVLLRALKRIAGLPMPIVADASSRLRDVELQALVTVQADELKSSLQTFKKAQRSVIFAHMPSATLERLALMDRVKNPWFGKWFLSSAQRIPDNVLDSQINPTLMAQLLKLGEKSAKAAQDTVAEDYCKSKLKKMRRSLVDLNGDDNLSGVDVDDRWPQ